jgi:hypothetical protein
MKKLYERLITAGGIATLIAIFTYQVAYGTNESSYKWGFKNGFQSSKCDPGMRGKCSAVDSFDACSTANPVTNVTACEDGFAQGGNKVSGTHYTTCPIYSNHCD